MLVLLVDFSLPLFDLRALPNVRDPLIMVLPEAGGVPVRPVHAGDEVDDAGEEGGSAQPWEPCPRAAKGEALSSVQANAALPRRSIGKPGPLA